MVAVTGPILPPTVQIQEQPILTYHVRFVTKLAIRRWIATTAWTTLIKVDIHMPGLPP